MEGKLQKFSRSKLGNNDTQNKDAVDSDQTRKTFCISDGSTESNYSGQWASLLVQNFIKNPFTKDQKDIDLKLWVGPIQKEWYDTVVPWKKLEDEYDVSLYEKTQLGAQATFLGFRLSCEKNTTRISAWAIGDSNLFIIRDGDLIKSFPIEKSVDFGTSPELVFSISKKVYSEESNLNSYVCSGGELSYLLEFDLKKDDLVIATTDALAKWFLSEYEIGHLPWDELQHIDDFNSFVELKIDSKEMINDDATVLLLEF